MDKCCCPCACAPYCPTGGPSYFKLSSDLCGPFMIVPQDDGTIDGTMQGIYARKGTAPPGNSEMKRDEVQA